MSKQPKPCRYRCGQCLQCDEYENYIEQDDGIDKESQCSKHCDSGYMNDVRFGE